MSKHLLLEIKELLDTHDKQQVPLRTELLELVRLLGMSAEREAALRAERDSLREALATIVVKRPDKHICLEIALKALAGEEIR